MTYRSLLLFALCATSVACSGEERRAPAVNSNIDSGFADRNVPETIEEDTAVDEDAGADADSTIDSTIVDSTPPDVASEVDGDALVDTAPDVAATCLNGSKDPDETDIDCGGTKCGKCAVGKTCAADSDCVEGKCNPGSKVCSPALCPDGVKNGTETDIDCGGGGMCARCEVSKGCLVGTDCTSGVCTSNLCAAPSCSDGVKNGAETDVDCGGTCTKKCVVGDRCNVATDCTSGTCAFDSGTGSNRCLCPSGMSRVGVPGGGGTYCMDQTEVTNEQYAKLFLGTGPSTTGQPSYCSWNTDFTPSIDWPAPEANFGHPVRGVDWCDALAYCKKQGKELCGKMTGGATPFDKYADHTVSKWFNACSQVVNAYPYSMATYDPARCNGADYWSDGGVPTVYPVLVPGTTTAFDPSRFLNKACIGGPISDIYQLSGNVAEWEDACDGTTGATDKCLVRGGSYQSNATALRCDANRPADRNTKSADIGIRCCL